MQMWSSLALLVAGCLAALMLVGCCVGQYGSTFGLRTVDALIGVGELVLGFAITGSWFDSLVVRFSSSLL